MLINCFGQIFRSRVSSSVPFLISLLMAQQTYTSTAHSDSTRSTGSRPTKTRRSHQKSRNGGTECKNRHMHCDERQPTCAHCETAERACSYPPPRVKQKKRDRENWSRNKRDESTSSSAPLLLYSNISSNNIAI